jgi:3-oxoacyl-[acyl-carrier-protein] synthase-3
MGATKYSTILAGVGHYVPETVITSDYINSRLNSKVGKKVGTMVQALTGIKERRYAPLGTNSSDLAVNAGKIALERAGVDPEKVDVLIFASASRDLAEPATANIIQEKLGINNAHVLDVGNACNSFINAVDIVDSFIKSGRCEIGLVVSGEVLSATVVDWDIKSIKALETGFASFTLGDGGGAFVLKGVNTNDERGIKASCFHSYGANWDISVVRGGGTMSPRNAEDTYFRSHSMKLNRLALKYVPLAVREILRKVGWKVGEVDLVVPHQVSESITKKLSRRTEIPIQKVMLTLQKYGNCAASSIPIALGEAIDGGIVKKGDKILLVGGAAGFSAGVIALVL